MTRERRHMTYPTDTRLVCETATEEILWTAFLTPEQYQRYMRKWAASGDPSEALKAICDEV